jgi:hypothetical protein
VSLRNSGRSRANDHLEMDVGGAEPGQLRQGVRPLLAIDGRRRRVDELDRLVREGATKAESLAG